MKFLILNKSNWATFTVCLKKYLKRISIIGNRPTINCKLCLTFLCTIISTVRSAKSFHNTMVFHNSCITLETSDNRKLFVRVQCINSFEKIGRSPIFVSVTSRQLESIQTKTVQTLLSHSTSCRD